MVRFNANGTWTVPAGVHFARVRMKGGGPGSTSNSDGVPGSASSVAFASGTITAPGGQGGRNGNSIVGVNGPANTGDGPSWRSSETYGYGSSDRSSGAGYEGGSGSTLGGGRWQGHEVSSGAPVTPGASISITVGAGGDRTKKWS